jgi:DNA-binding transcriptional ArsR family regulator
VRNSEPRSTTAQNSQEFLGLHGHNIGRKRPNGQAGDSAATRIAENGRREEVFRGLADPTRRSLLDALFKEDGQTLSALEQRVPMTRFGVMKHLKLLEQAGLVVTRRRGREPMILSGLKTLLETGEMLTTPGSLRWSQPAKAGA